ncbi:hypothetical protein OUZ56_032340 [Daphnia magna]|uniref:Uncharacterized protein n=1 Tax=Daphnia magna TaxID=35525 RepID=A0ABR0B8M3_9CRUS|nr:hypothetical protein OUZ56_032340 [Daphnia magna]
MPFVGQPWLLRGSATRVERDDRREEPGRDGAEAARCWGRGAGEGPSGHFGAIVDDAGVDRRTGVLFDGACVGLRGGFVNGEARRLGAVGRRVGVGGVRPPRIPFFAGGGDGRLVVDRPLGSFVDGRPEGHRRRLRAAGGAVGDGGAADEAPLCRGRAETDTGRHRPAGDERDPFGQRIGDDGIDGVVVAAIRDGDRVNYRIPRANRRSTPFAGARLLHAGKVRPERRNRRHKRPHRVFVGERIGPRGERKRRGGVVGFDAIGDVDNVEIDAEVAPRRAAQSWKIARILQVAGEGTVAGRSPEDRAGTVEEVVARVLGVAERNPIELQGISGDDGQLGVEAGLRNAEAGDRPADRFPAADEVEAVEEGDVPVRRGVVFVDDHQRPAGKGGLLALVADVFEIEVRKAKESSTLRRNKRSNVGGGLGPLGLFACDEARRIGVDGDGGVRPRAVEGDGSIDAGAAARPIEARVADFRVGREAEADCRAGVGRFCGELRRGGGVGRVLGAPEDVEGAIGGFEAAVGVAGADEGRRRKRAAIVTERTAHQHDISAKIEGLPGRKVGEGRSAEEKRGEREGEADGGAQAVRHGASIDRSGAQRN